MTKSKILEDYSSWYEFVPNPVDKKDPEFCVKIIKGTWSGIILKYKNFLLNREQVGEHSHTLQYNFDLLYVPEEILDVEFPDEYQKEFNTILGKVLYNVISKDVEIKENTNNGKSGNTYSEGVTLRRFVYEESDPILKG